MKLMKNKWFIFALMWFGLIVYGLLRESPPNGVSLFPHFDKVAHFLLFFCRFVINIQKVTYITN